VTRPDLTLFPVVSASEKAHSCLLDEDSGRSESFTHGRVKMDFILIYGHLLTVFTVSLISVGFMIAR